MEIKVSNEVKYEIVIYYHNLIDELNKQVDQQDYFVCLDKKVYEYHYDYLHNILKNAKGYLIIDANEDNKNFATLNEIHDMLFKHQAQRSSYLIAIGGGIIGDVVGLAASLYLRGMKFIQVPTTLLSQVDSSIGNKVAVNAYETKNTIGTFFAPTKVIIDLHFLKTLTTRIFKEGLVELIKHGLIKDASIIEDLKAYENINQLMQDYNGLKELIIKSLNVKKSIVQEDPLDQHLRHILNYGHTFAHALELHPDNELYHGECVAIGMLVNAKMSADEEIYLIIKEILERFQCLKPLPLVAFDKIYHDKKRNSHEIKEAFLTSLGQCQIKKVEINTLIEAFKDAYLKIKDEVSITKNRYVFKPTSLKGEVVIPPSKSMLHRYLIAAALSQQKTILKNISSLFDDVYVTMKALEAFKVKAIYYETTQEIIIEPDYSLEQPKVINMKESGTSLRLLMPLLINVYNQITITGENKLPYRPLDTYLDIFKEQGIKISKADNAYLPLSLAGNLKADNYRLAGNISSQFISGLLFALPLCDGNSSITLITPPESIPYIEMTLETLKDFNILINHNDDYTYFAIAGNQIYFSNQVYEIEQDYSSRCFFEVLKSFEQHEITIKNQSSPSLQGDQVIIDVIKNNVKELDLKHIPDSAPIMAIYYAVNGGGCLLNTNRLKYKESNRLEAIIDYLDKMSITYHFDEAKNLHIKPGIIQGNHFDTYLDHRITMSLIVASTIAQDSFYLDEIKSINKSFQTFIKEYEKIGGFVDEE